MWIIYQLHFTREKVVFHPDAVMGHALWLIIIKITDVNTENNSSSYHRFKVTFDHSKLNNNNKVTQEVDTHIDLGGKKIPLINHSRGILNDIAYRLFVGIPTIGRKSSLNSIVIGYTEYKKDGFISRSSPCYDQRMPWFNWAYFQLTEIEKQL